MLTCPRCKRSNPDVALFCHFEGAELRSVAGASRLPRPPTVLGQVLHGAQRVSSLITALTAGLALFASAAHAHDRWDNGEPVPAWVKTECCGPRDAHHLLAITW